MAGRAAEVFQPRSGSARAWQLPALQGGCLRPDSIRAVPGAGARRWQEGCRGS